MYLELISIILLLFLSGFFSSAEIAYLRSNKIKLEVEKKKKNLMALNAYYFFKNPGEFFTTILIGNNIINISFTTLASILLGKYFNLDALGILFITTLVILFFAELIPKYFAIELADKLFMTASIPLRIVNFVLFPLVSIINKISRSFTSTQSLSNESILNLYSKEDIEFLVQEGFEAGKVDKADSSAIKKVMNLQDQRINEVMRPRTEIVGVELGSTIDEVIDMFIESGFSKLPVYEENLDNIRGFIIAYDLFDFPASLNSILREMLFVPESKRSIDMLDAFLEKGVSVAIVVDEFGGTAGIISMEDIIEELFGEIKDEYDIDENICKKINEKTFIISGKVEIDHINEQFNLTLPDDGDYETVAGLISSFSGKIPSSGEEIVMDNYKFQIIRSTKTKIDLIKLIVLEQ